MTMSAARTLFSKDGVSLLASAAGSVDGGNDHHDDGDGGGIILTLAMNRRHEKNVVNPTMISLLTQALDVVDSHPALADTNDKALVITGLSLNGDSSARNDKFFSNGLDLEWMLRAGNKKTSVADGGTSGSDPVSSMIESFNSLVLARILTLPFRTVAAINGHCIGAGLFVALACDYRIMRTERGYVQWPEARLGMKLSKGFAELSKAKVDSRVLREGVLTAKKYTSSEALASGIIDAECPVEDLYGRALQLAKEGLPESPSQLNLEYFDPKAYTEVKVELYTDAYRALKFGKVETLPHSRI